jgi:hypothetical protein
MLYGSKYTAAINGIRTGDGINSMNIGDGVNDANGISTANLIQTGNGNNLANDKKAMDALYGVAHT